MRYLDRPLALGRRLHMVLGGPGILIAVFSVVSFVFGLGVLIREYNRPRSVGESALHATIDGWARSPDYLGLTLGDHVDLWRRADSSAEVYRRGEVEAALERLGDELDHYGSRYPLVRPVDMELMDADGSTIAHWQPRTDLGDLPTDVTKHVRIDQGGKPTTLIIRSRIAPAIGRAALGLETSYRRLLLALLGMSGYSLLCLGYMVLHARNLRDRAARDAAREATLDLADRTCHELGNGVFVLSNERRNLSDHLDLIESFIDAEPIARAAAADRAGLDPNQVARFEHALKREYAERGIDPALELTRSTELARHVCRQIGVSSDYIALTVRELDGYLKSSSLPLLHELVDVKSCLDEAFALLGPKLQSEDARVERRDMEQGDSTVLADRRLLIHVFVNLIKNAIEAAEHPVIVTSLRIDRDRLWVSIADNGPGLGNIAKIFVDGFSTKGPGRGRGLAIVHESVETLGAELKVESRPEKGTVFMVGLKIQ